MPVSLLAPWPLQQQVRYDLLCHPLSAFSVLGLDPLSPRKANVQEQTFYPSQNLLCWKQAIDMSTCSGKQGRPHGALLGAFLAHGVCGR